MALKFLACLLIAVSLQAQTLTFAPAAAVKTGVPWSVTLCAPVDYQIAIGNIYAQLVSAGITPMDYQTAWQAITAKQQRSKAAKVATWFGYAAAGAAFLMANKTIEAKPGWETASSSAAGFFNLVVPLAQRAEPDVSALLARVARDADVLHVPAGGCDTTIVIAGPGKAFNVQLK